VVPRVVGFIEPHHLHVLSKRTGIPMEILIQGDNAFNMKVLDAETGDLVKRVKKIELEITATSSVAKIHIVNPKVNIKANAEVVEATSYEVEQ
jgi:hypothetical protein